MTVQNALNLLHELSQIEEKISELEQIERIHQLDIDLESLLITSFNQSTR